MVFIYSHNIKSIVIPLVDKESNVTKLLQIIVRNPETYILILLHCLLFSHKKLIYPFYVQIVLQIAKCFGDTK